MTLLTSSWKGNPRYVSLLFCRFSTFHFVECFRFLLNLKPALRCFRRGWSERMIITLHWRFVTSCAADKTNLLTKFKSAQVFRVIKDRAVLKMIRICDPNALEKYAWLTFAFANPRITSVSLGVTLLIFSVKGKNPPMCSLLLSVFLFFFYYYYFSILFFVFFFLFCFFVLFCFLFFLGEAQKLFRQV